MYLLVKSINNEVFRYLNLENELFFSQNLVKIEIKHLRLYLLYLNYNLFQNNICRAFVFTRSDEKSNF